MSQDFTPTVVTRDGWEAARERLRAREPPKDALAAQRRRMPWMAGRLGWTMPWYTLTDDFDKDFGRQEEWEDSPAGYPRSAPYQWWNWHDAYDEAGPFRDAVPS
jgi:predicted dithiol-disulfide oxidoreductase (DUF899 family)